MNKTQWETVLIKVKDWQFHLSEPKLRNEMQRSIYCRVPPEWTENDELKYPYIEKIFSDVYGANRTVKNAEGWSYYVSGFYSHVLSSGAIARRVWTDETINNKGATLFFIRSEANEFRHATLDEFQSHVDSSMQIGAREKSAEAFWQDSPESDDLLSKASSDLISWVILISLKRGTLSTPSGGLFTSSSKWTENYFCCVPTSWIDGRNIKKFYLEKFFEKIFGQDWRLGLSDGSRIHFQDFNSIIFSPAITAKIKWSEISDNLENHFLFYEVSETDEMNEIEAAEFQAEIRSVSPKIDFSSRAQKDLKMFSDLNLEIPERLINFIRYFDRTGGSADNNLFNGYLHDFIVERLAEAGTKLSLDRVKDWHDKGWSIACWHLYRDGLHHLAHDREHQTAAKNVFEEMVDFCTLLPGVRVPQRIAAIFELFLVDYVLPDKIKALLPDKAYREFPAMEMIFAEWREDAESREEENFRLGQMGY